MRTPISRSEEVSGSFSPFIKQSKVGVGATNMQYFTFLTLNSIPYVSAQLVRLFKQSKSIFLSLSEVILYPSLISSANFLRMLMSVTLKMRSLIQIIKDTGPRTWPWITTIKTSSQKENFPFSVSKPVSDPGCNAGNCLFKMQEIKSALFSYLTDKIGKLRFQN